MQTKLNQLVISALKRNPQTAPLHLGVSIQGYQVVIAGEVPDTRLVDEILTTVKMVSPHLQVQSQLTVAPALA